MISKILRTFAASLALCLISAIPASADDVDISNPARTINIRTNKPYIQYDIVSSELKDPNKVSLIIRDKSGREVAYSCMVNDLTKHTVEPYVRTVWETIRWIFQQFRMRLI